MKDRKGVGLICVCGCPSYMLIRMSVERDREAVEVTLIQCIVAWESEKKSVICLFLLSIRAEVSDVFFMRAKG